MLKFKVHNIQIVFLSGLRTKHKKNRIHATKLSVLQFMNSKRIVPGSPTPNRHLVKHMMFKDSVAICASRGLFPLLVDPYDVCSTPYGAVPAHTHTAAG